MKPHKCCQIDKRAGDPHRRPPSSWRRGGEIAGWLLPTTMLALLPKCPACVAAYIALATGLSISLPTAACLRTTLIILCIAALIFIIARRLHRSRHRPSPSLPPQSC